MKKLIKKGQKGIYVPSQSNFLQKVKDFWNAPREYKQVPIYNRLGGNPEDIKAQIQQDVQNAPTATSSMKDMMLAQVEAPAMFLAPNLALGIAGYHIGDSFKKEGLTGENILGAALIGLPGVGKVPGVKTLYKSVKKNVPPFIGKITRRDPYNGSAAMMTQETIHGNPLTVTDLEQSGLPIRMKSDIKFEPSVEYPKGPFFADYKNKALPFRVEITPEQSQELKTTLKGLRERNNYIQEILNTRTLNGQRITGRTRANFEAELAHNNDMIKEIGTIQRKNYFPTDQAPSYAITNPSRPSVEIPKAPDTQKVTYTEVKVKNPTEIESTSTAKTEAQRATYQNKKDFTKRQNYEFQQARAWATGDARSAKSGRSMAQENAIRNKAEQLEKAGDVKYLRLKNKLEVKLEKRKSGYPNVDVSGARKELRTYIKGKL